jgi:hypothetical protein
LWRALLPTTRLKITQEIAGVDLGVMDMFFDQSDVDPEKEAGEVTIFS